MKIIYGIESYSSMTGKRRLNSILYVERKRAVLVAGRIDRHLEPEIVEFHLNDEKT